MFCYVKGKIILKNSTPVINKICISILLDEIAKIAGKVLEQLERFEPNVWTTYNTSV